MNQELKVLGWPSISGTMYGISISIIGFGIFIEAKSELSVLIELNGSYTGLACDGQYHLALLNGNDY